MSDEIVPVKSSLAVMMAQWMQVQRKIIEAEGVMTEDDEAKMDVLDLSIPEKIDATAFVIDMLESNAEVFKEKAKEIYDVALRFENAAKFRKERVKRILIESERKEIRGNDRKFQIVEMRPKLVITDEGSLPGKYFTDRVVYDLDKKKLMADLENGDLISHAHTERVFALRKQFNTKEVFEKKKKVKPAELTTEEKETT